VRREPKAVKMKLWQCQIESDKEGGEENETDETEEEEIETEEESGAEENEGGIDEEEGEEDESAEDSEERHKETEENVGDDTNIPKEEEEEEEEDAEIFGYEKIEKSEIEELDCSGMRNRGNAARSSFEQVDKVSPKEEENNEKRCDGNKINGLRISSLDGITKEGEKYTELEDSMKGIDETEMITKEYNMKENTSEKQKHLERLLVTAKEAPAYNLEIGITSGYRQPLGYTACLRSVFQIHNETVNIWTHLLGFAFFLWLLFDNCFRHQNHLRDKLDLVATCLQLLSYQVCMVNSAAFHTFLCHSKEAKATWHSADHCGILIAFLGTYIRIIITTLRCFPDERLAHLTIVFLLFGTVIAIKYRPGGHGDAKVPLSLFYALALYVIAPFAHWVHLSHGAHQYYVTTSMVLWMWSPYLVASVGLGFYLSRWPERLVGGCWTGCVDIYGHSHQIWHVLIFSAMASWHYLAVWVSRESPTSCQIHGTDFQDSMLTPTP